MSIAATRTPSTSSSDPRAAGPATASRGIPGGDHRLRVVRPVALDVEVGPDGRGREVPTVVGADLVVPTVHGLVGYANLDHAASTPALVAVKLAVDTALETYSSVHRGNGYASTVTSEWYEQAREEVASFVGARPDDTVIFTRNTTDSFNLLARSLPQDTTVVVFETEHHSTLLPWKGTRTVTLPIPASIEQALADLEAALAQAATPHRLVVVGGASNVTGELWPLAAIAAVARRHSARVAVDAAQLAPHRAIDIEATGVDYVAFSGHKVYAPFGAGVLAGRSDWLDAAPPYLRGGGATARVSTAGTTWATGPARHEGGSPNVIGAIALAAACATLAAHRLAIDAHEARLLAQLRGGLSVIPGVDTWSIFGPDHDRVGVVALTIERLDSSLVSAILSAEYGIGVRDGKFCAHLLVDELLEDPWGEVPATAVRISLGLATTAEHVERVLAAVAALAADGPQRRYVRTDRGWRPEGDTRVLTRPRPW